MPLLMSFRLALRALGRNKLQTALTMLGLVIGVAAVLTMVALGTGAQASIEEKIRAAGTNVITIRAGNYDVMGRGDEAGLAVEDEGPVDMSSALPPAGLGYGPGAGPNTQPRRNPDQPFWTTPRRNVPPGRGASTALVPADGDAIRTDVPGVRFLAVGVSDNARLRADDRRHFTKLEGAGPELANIRSWAIRHGRFFTEEEVRAAAPVVVLGGSASDQLFGPGVNPVGRDIELQERPFTVIGVTTSPRAGALRANDPTDAAFVPYTTAQEILRITHLHTITVASAEAGEATRVSQDIAMLLRVRHGIGPEDPDDCTVRTQAKEALMGKGLHPNLARAVVGNVPGLEHVTLEEMALTLQQASRTMTTLLASVAGVSLLVGGIGIMNIMLVSVTERTREIGIRMAVGARGRDVLQQFLIEALTLSLIGGVVGILVGLLASGGVTQFLQWSTSVSPGAVALAFGVAGAVGVFFGFYPARQASRLDPIEALRYD